MNSPSATTAMPDVAPIKARQQAAWSTGNDAIVGTTLQIVGEQPAWRPPLAAEDNETGRGTPCFGPALLVGLALWVAIALLLFGS